MGVLVFVLHVDCSLGMFRVICLPETPIKLRKSHFWVSISYPLTFIFHFRWGTIPSSNVGSHGWKLKTWHSVLGSTIRVFVGQGFLLEQYVRSNLTVQKLGRCVKLIDLPSFIFILSQRIITYAPCVHCSRTFQLQISKNVRGHRLWLVGPMDGWMGCEFYLPRPMLWFSYHLGDAFIAVMTWTTISPHRAL